MKRTSKITFLLSRILMGVVFLLSAVGFFLNKDQSIRAEYLFNCGQSAMFLIVSCAPIFLKKVDVDIPDWLYMVFILFCMAHFFCGEILGFFATIKWWDSLLHTFSGAMITLLSFSFINLLNNQNDSKFKLSLGFVVMFAFSLTLAIGTLWEIVEFSVDGIFNTNMQRAYVSNVSGARGEALSGGQALLDTMKDLILDTIGSACVCIVCSIYVTKKGGSVSCLSFIHRRTKTDVKIELEEGNLVQKEANLDAEKDNENIIE